MAGEVQKLTTEVSSGRCGFPEKAYPVAGGDLPKISAEERSALYSQAMDPLSGSQEAQIDAQFGKVDAGRAVESAIPGADLRPTPNGVRGPVAGGSGDEPAIGPH